MATTTLKSIRAHIAELQRKLAETEKAIPPAADLEAQLRGRLASIAPVKELVENAALGLLTGSFGSLTPETAPVLAKHAYAMAVEAVGIENIIRAAVKEATERDDGRLRLTPEDRLEAIFNLRVAIYGEELAEQELLGNEPQRPDVSGAALLRLPLDVFIERIIQNA